MNRKDNRRYNTLYIFVSKEYLLSFLVAFAFFFSIFFVNQLLVIAKNILLANVSLVDVLLIIFYSIPVILSFTFPFASLTGASMTIGQLNSSNELLALRAGGISLYRILAPVLVISMLLTISSFLLNDMFLPYGTIKYKELYRELLYRNPDLELHQNSVTRFGNTFFIAGDIEDDTVDDLIIIDQGISGVSLITSDSATFTASAEAAEERDGLLSINLADITGFYPRSQATGDFDSFSALEMQYNILLQNVNYSFMSTTPNDMSIRDVYAAIRDMRADEQLQAEQREVFRHSLYYDLVAAYFSAPEHDTLKDLQKTNSRFEQYLEDIPQNRRLNFYLIEFYKKSALPAACTVLALFVFPLSAFRLKNGRIVGFGVGVVVSTVYWFLLFGVQTVGSRTLFPPFLLMWLPNMLFGAIGILLLVLRRRA